MSESNDRKPIFHRLRKRGTWPPRPGHQQGHPDLPNDPERELDGVVRAQSIPKKHPPTTADGYTTYEDNPALQDELDS